MGPFDWLKRKRGPEREARYVVSVNEAAIGVVWPDGEDQAVSFDALEAVGIETNASGPWGSDLWWLLFGRDGRRACAFPQGATGEQAAIDRLMAFPGFDHQEMVRAMGSTESGLFIVWRASAAEG